MAFGTWLKKAFTKAKDFTVNKVIPGVKTVAGFLGKAASPILGAVGGVVGGPLGSTISNVGDKIGAFANKTNTVLDRTNMRLGGFGGGIQPILK